MAEQLHLDDSCIEYPAVRKDLFPEGTLPVYTTEHAEAVIYGGKAALDSAFEGLDDDHAVALADAVEAYADEKEQK
jgi:hypothetical protein